MLGLPKAELGSYRDEFRSQRGHRSFQTARSLRGQRKSFSFKPARCTAEPTNPRRQEEAKLTPAFKKYLTPVEIARYDYEHWKELSADGVDVPQPTAGSLAMYPLQFLKYNAVPEVIRYAWYIVWIRLCAAYTPYHKKFVLQGAKLDAYLHQKGNPGEDSHVNRAHALRRYHWKMGVLANLKIRLSLLKAACLSSFLWWRRRNIQEANDSTLAAPKII